MRIKGILFFLALTLAACAEQNVTSEIDPAYRKLSPQVWKVAVLGVGMSLAEQKAIENSAVKHLVHHKRDGLIGREIVSPTSEATPAQVRHAFAKAGADVLLEITVLDKHRYRDHPTYVPGFTYMSYVEDSNGQLAARHTTVPTRLLGGPNFVLSDATYRARLIDLENSKVIWVADVNQYGYAAHYEVQAADTARDVIDALVMERLLVGKLY